MANPGNLTDAQMEQLAQRIAALANPPTDAPTDAPAPGVRQYVGARYVPIFADPLEWSDTREYEPLTVVTYQGNSYTSRQYVPTGIEVTNTEYWALSGNFNAQVEAYRQEVQVYRQEVQAFEKRITDNETAISAAEEDIAGLQADVTQLEAITDQTIIILGDSWSDTNPDTTIYTKWPAIIAKQTKMTIKNYAKNGSTLSYENNNYGPNGDLLGQVNAAIADTSFNHARVAKIVVVGGINDLRKGRKASEFNAGFKNNLAKLAAAFPNVPIVYCCNYQIMVTRNDWTWMCNVVRAVHALGYAAYTMLGWVSFKNHIEDRIHPNDAGYIEIAGNMSKILFGGGSLTYVSDYWSKVVGEAPGQVLTCVVQHAYDNCNITGYAQFQNKLDIADATRLGSFSFDDTSGLLTSGISYTGIFNVATGMPTNIVLAGTTPTERNTGALRVIGTGAIPASGNIGTSFPINS